LTDSTRILGIDPGLRNTGWGIIESEGNRLKFVACGVIKPDNDLPMADRLAHIHTELQKIIAEYQPQEAVVEETFVNANAASALKLGQARGVALLTPALSGLAVAEYSATQVKKAVVGAGHADKNQIATMIGHLLPGAKATLDAADALAVAVCHANTSGTQRLIKIRSA
jgi:crossover junction endodeoxyribonuclease RuvC